MTTRTATAFVLTAAVSLTLAGCGGDGGRSAPSADSLRSYLKHDYRYSDGYADLVGSPITVKSDGSVDVTLPASWYVKYVEAARLCTMISGWVYDQGNGGHDSSITLRSNGDIVSKRRGEADVCNAGDPALG